MARQRNRGALLHGGETAAFGDAGYRGIDKQEDAQGPAWHVAIQPGKRKQLRAKHPLAQMLKKAEQFKASERAKVEHPFHVVKNMFGNNKARYKGMTRNEAQLFGLFGVANLVIAKRSLSPLMPKLHFEQGNRPAMSAKRQGLSVRSNIDCLHACKNRDGVLFVVQSH